MNNVSGMNGSEWAEIASRALALPWPWRKCTDVGRVWLKEAITFVSIRVSPNVTNDPEKKKHERQLSDEFGWNEIWASYSSGIRYAHKRMTQKALQAVQIATRWLSGLNTSRVDSPRKKKKIVFISDEWKNWESESFFRNVISSG